MQCQPFLFIFGVGYHMKRSNSNPLLEHLDELEPGTQVGGEHGIGCYIQYTLNDYAAEGLERKVPPVQERIDTFRRIVDRLGMWCGGSTRWYLPIELALTI